MCLAGTSGRYHGQWVFKKVLITGTPQRLKGLTKHPIMLKVLHLVRTHDTKCSQDKVLLTALLQTTPNTTEYGTVALNHLFLKSL